MTRVGKRKMSVELVQSSEMLNTRVIAAIIAKKIREGECE